MTSITRIVFLLEKTYSMGLYIQNLKESYIIPIIKLFDKKINDSQRVIYSLVTFGVNDPFSITQSYPPTCESSEILSWIDQLLFISGMAEPFSHLAEGLATALNVFDDFEDIYPSELADSKCVIITNSNYYDYPAFESHTYHGLNIEALLTIFAEKSIEVSIISPKKLNKLYYVFQRANNTSSIDINYGLDERDLVLLKGFQLKLPEQVEMNLSTTVTDTVEKYPSNIVPVQKRALPSSFEDASSNKKAALPTISNPNSITTEAPSVPNSLSKTGSPMSEKVLQISQENNNSLENAPNTYSEDASNSLPEVPSLDSSALQKSQELKNSEDSNTSPNIASPATNVVQKSLAPKKSSVIKLGEQRITIWQGLFEFTPPSTGSGANPRNSYSCTITSNSENGSPQVNAENWPNVISMNIIPRYIFTLPPLDSSLKGGRQMEFHFSKDVSGIQLLYKTLTSGYVGCIQLPQPRCEIRYIVVLYVPEGDCIIGVIAKDQVGFHNSLQLLHDTFKNTAYSNSKDPKITITNVVQLNGSEPARDALPQTSLAQEQQKLPKQKNVTIKSIKIRDQPSEVKLKPLVAKGFKIILPENLQTTTYNNVSGRNLTATTLHNTCFTSSTQTTKTAPNIVNIYKDEK